MLMPQSPLQLKDLGQMAVQTRLGVELFKAMQGLREAMDDVRGLVQEAHTISNEARTHLSRVQSLPRGERGERGEKGDNTPIKGVDYATPQEIQELAEQVRKAIREPKDGKTPVKGVDFATEEDYVAIARLAATLIPKPRDGKDAVIRLEDIESAVEGVLKKRKIKTTEIDGLDSTIRSFSSQLAGKIYGKDTWARGGGDTVEAGSGIFITSSDGKKVISASGSGITIETPTGTVNASNTTFTPTAEPLYVVADGIQYFDGAGYAWGGTDIVMDVPPSSYIRAVISS